MVEVQIPDALLDELKQATGKTDPSEAVMFAAQFMLTHWQEELGMDYFKERAARADRAAFLAVLDKAQDTPPLPGDELP